jgi:demethylmenaquinone methyltransferase/2-methoxy-6-polyprenyl-1,4-benzoquinol methylase
VEPRGTDAATPARHDYRDQAERYDRTRGASPSILSPLVRALDGAPGRRLLDVAGGTGNYAAALRERGWEPVVLDVSAEMLERAAAKGLPVVRAPAGRLPVAVASVDAVTNVSALHLIRDWRAALRETRRVLRPGGRLALMVYAREHLDVHWIFEYFPSSRAWVDPEHQMLAELLSELPGASVEPFEFTDLVDASMSAMCRYPHLLLDPEWRLQTSFFERLERADPTGARAGLERLERDLTAGRRPDVEVAEQRARFGDGAVIAWQAVHVDG